jgi:hypothetical protein
MSEKVYVLLADDDGKMRSRPTPFGYAVKSEEEAMKFTDLKNFSYQNDYEELLVFDTVEEALAHWREKK